ncbi:hypothetical protein D0863_01640 [Hortaea werneckii]|uniref:Heterokaryon incompatibility domain-containing protein n=1 Tax=Hortaea werneckii TaxID=91943 RepID=A0A3M7EKD5_HORWE|nr:hypothetical protein D0863_01640 [Hortaea werneckii]
MILWIDRRIRNIRLWIDRTVHGTNHSKNPYQPLDNESLEIRLLTVYAATDPSEVPVKCSLSHANLGKEPKPEYETISYTWGKSTEQKTVIIDDIPLEVPVSAERAIRRMRLRDQKRVLWIDAICVNQADTSERNHQVGLMTEIYSNTTQGLIWLGEADDSTEKALKSINAACAELDAKIQDSHDLYAEVIGRTSRLLEPFGFAPDFAALVRFFQLPWFGRRWVIQEALLAPSSQCIIGKLEISWANTLRGTVWIRHKARMLPAYEGFAQAARSVLYIWFVAEDMQAGKRLSLEYIMSSTVGSKVGDERDTIYALLGLWLKLQHQTKPHPLLAPDYHKSPEAAICDATRYIAAVEKNLFYLRSTHHRRNTDPLEKKLPSWAAIWHRESDLSCDPKIFLAGYNAHGQSWWRHFRPPAQESSRILSIRGKMVEHVRAVTKVADADYTPGHVKAKIEQLETTWSSFRQQDSELNSSSRLGEVLIAGRTVFCTRATEDFSVWGYAEWREYLRQEKSWPPPWRTIDECEAPTLRKVAEYHRAFLNACNNRIFFITDSGRLGVGPQTLKEDDLVAILYGCNFPVTLRRYPNSDRHEFIGPAYIGGIMDGEAVEEAEARGIGDVTFHLQ